MTRVAAARTGRYNPSRRSPIPDPRTPDPITPESWQYVAIRWLTYLALSTAIGALAARFYLRPDPSLGSELANERRLARWADLSCITLAILAGARLWAQWQTLGGSETGSFTELMRPMLFETLWGVGLIGQTVLAIVASFAFGAAPRRTAWYIAAGATVLLSVTPALSGHAVAESRPLLGVTLDTLHVLAGGTWLGTLIVILSLALPVLGDGAARKALHLLLVRFSKLALTSAAVLTVTGIYAAWVHVGSWAALWSTPYGGALVLKVCVLLVAAALGAMNWRVAVPRLTLGRVPLFAATGTAEVFAALLIYLLTAVLVGRPLPME